MSNDTFEPQLRKNMIKVLEYTIEQLKKDTTYLQSASHGTRGERLEKIDHVEFAFVDANGNYEFSWRGRPWVRSPLPPLFIKDTE